MSFENIILWKINQVPKSTQTMIPCIQSSKNAYHIGGGDGSWPTRGLAGNIIFLDQSAR